MNWVPRGFGTSSCHTYYSIRRRVRVCNAAMLVRMTQNMLGFQLWDEMEAGHSQLSWGIIRDLVYWYHKTLLTSQLSALTITSLERRQLHAHIYLQWSVWGNSSKGGKNWWIQEHLSRQRGCAPLFSLGPKRAALVAYYPVTTVGLTMFVEDKLSRVHILEMNWYQ